MLKRMFLLQEIGIHQIIFRLKRRVVLGRLIAFRIQTAQSLVLTLNCQLAVVVISKATNPEHESYSVFDGTSFAHELKMCEVKRLFVGGLATDYCVVNTVLDARKLGYETVVLMDATLGINVEPGDVDRAIEAMLKAGAEQATNDDFPDAVDTLPIEETEPDAIRRKAFRES